MSDFFKRKKKIKQIEYAFHVHQYFFEEINTTIPWAKIRYSTS